MNKEENYKQRLEVIQSLLSTVNDNDDKPYFSSQWVIDNLFSDETEREKAKRELIYEKRNRIIKKILGK